MGTVWDDEKVLEVCSGDGCYRTVHLKMVQMANFMLCTLLQLKTTTIIMITNTFSEDSHTVNQKPSEQHSTQSTFLFLPNS